MFSSDDVGVHDTGGGVQGIHSRVDAQLGDGTGQYSRGVQVSEGGGWSRVSQVVSGHIDGLQREQSFASSFFDQIIFPPDR